MSARQGGRQCCGHSPRWTPRRSPDDRRSTTHLLLPSLSAARRQSDRANCRCSRWQASDHAKWTHSASSSRSLAHEQGLPSQAHPRRLDGASTRRWGMRRTSEVSTLGRDMSVAVCRACSANGSRPARSAPCGEPVCSQCHSVNSGPRVWPSTQAAPARRPWSHVHVYLTSWPASVRG